jgi:CspA family cold shock protein
MPTGTVKWFNSTKGYGFIAPDDGGKDVFVHISAVERAGLKGLSDNQKIGYELQSGRDGKQSAGDRVCFNWSARLRSRCPNRDTSDPRPG